MPYRLSGLCVEVETDDGWEAVEGGCHDTTEEAQAHLDALNINVSESKHVADGTVAKLDEDRQLVFGYAYFAQTAKGDQVVDHSGDFVPDPENLETVAYEFVVKSRTGDVMHDAEPTSTLVESVVLTAEKAEAMSLDVESAPKAAWWVGFRVNDAETWERVKSGELGSFSIHGKGTVEEVEI